MDTLIGRPIGRREDLRLLTGAGRFADDIVADGAARAAFVRSQHAHARIRRLDAAKARTAPGVLAILTGEEYLGDGHGALAHYLNNPDHLDISKPAFAPGEILHDPTPQQVPIAGDRVRHVGEILAVVVAETEAAALDAAELVEVDYAPLPAVTDARAAMAAGAPRVWDGENLCLAAGNGDRDAAEAAFARADRVVRLAAHHHRVCPTPMEPRAAIGRYDAASERYRLEAPSQGVHRYKGALTAALGIAPDRIRIVTPDVGGGFGVRTACSSEYVLLLWAARRVGRPVKWTATRSEAFLSDCQARDIAVDGALALDGEGRFLGLRLDYVGNLGAYPISFAVLANLLRLAGGAYDIPAVHVTVKGVFTHTVPVLVYRGAGRPESAYIVERLIDLAAAELGIDRAAIRRRNLIAPEALPYQSPLGHLYDSGAFVENFDTAVRLIGWEGFDARRAEAAARRRLAGIGIANYLETPTGAPNERTDIRVLPEGTVEAVIGTQASGQGHETSFAQVVASVLEIPLEQVAIVYGDSDRAVSGGGSHSDRSMRLGGTVLFRASEEIVARGRERAGRMLEAAASDIVYADGRFTVAGTDRSIGLFEVAAAEPLAATSDFLGRLHAQPNGVAACEVEVDPETGAVAVTRYVTVDDVGSVINPIIVDGQVHGGIAQGVGQAVLEHCAYGAESGQLLSGSLLDYALPRADDLPAFSVNLNSLPAPSNPLGVKGAGECGTTPATAAVVGAVVDALRGYRVGHVEMPLTPQRVWLAMRDAARAS